MLRRTSLIGLVFAVVGVQVLFIMLLQRRNEDHRSGSGTIFGADLSNYEKHFSKWTSARGNCRDKQIGEWFRTRSAKEAGARCMAEPRCTFFTRWGAEVPPGAKLPETRWEVDPFITAGFTVLCSEFSGVDACQANEGWVSAARKGCEADGRSSMDGLDAFIPGFRSPKCYDARPCGVCTAPAEHHVLACGMHGRHVCHECPEGNCPEVQADLHPGFTRALHEYGEEVSRRKGRPFHTYNPTIAKHRGVTYLLARITDQARCNGEGWIQPPLQPYESFVLLCVFEAPPGSETDWQPFRDCRILDIDLVALLSNSPYMGGQATKDRNLYVSDFLGFEDARGFSWKGSLYLVGAAVVGRRKDGIPVSRAVVLQLDDRLRAATAAFVLYPSTGDGCQDDTPWAQKNWIFLKNDGESALIFVYNLSPYIIMRCEMPSGCCKKMSARDTKLPESALGGYRGGSPAVLTSNGQQFLLLVHRRVDFQPMRPRSLPSVYHHKMVVLDAQPPFTVLDASPAFRLPMLSASLAGGLVRDVAQDIQFVAGMDLTNGAVVLTYGVGDCVSALARLGSVSSFWSLAAPSSGGQAPAHVLRSPPGGPEAEEPLAGGGEADSIIRVRLEGPMRSMQSFAMVNKRIAEGLSADPDIRLSVVDTGDHVDLHFFLAFLSSTGEEEGFGRWGPGIIDGNRRNAWSAVHADVTVRNLWPLQLDAPVVGRVVLNFPWEFFHIPDEWAAKMASNVIDEIWTPTSFCKDGLVASGVPESKIVVVPHGVDAAEICPPRPGAAHGGGEGTREEAERLVVRREVEEACGKDSFVFLYHGGVLHRKALDLVLQAYFGTFTGNDRVCFVVHSMYWDEEAWHGVQQRYDESQEISWEKAWRTSVAKPDVVLEAWKGISASMATLNCTRDLDCVGLCHKDGMAHLYYRRSSLEPLPASTPEPRFGEVCLLKNIKRGAFRDGQAPPPAMLVSTQVLSAAARSELFALSGVLVHPSRSEGFGLSVAEAMACNLSVITTDRGAVADFTSEATAWLVGARAVRCAAKPCEEVEGGGQASVFGAEMSRPPLWLDFDPAELGALMRRVWRSPAEAAAKADKARAFVQRHLPWSRAQGLMLQRLRGLKRRDGRRPSAELD